MFMFQFSQLSSLSLLLIPRQCPGAAFTFLSDGMKLKGALQANVYQFHVPV